MRSEIRAEIAVFMVVPRFSREVTFSTTRVSAAGSLISIAVSWKKNRLAISSLGFGEQIQETMERLFLAWWRRLRFAARRRASTDARTLARRAVLLFRWSWVCLLFREHLFCVLGGIGVWGGSFYSLLPPHTLLSLLSPDRTGDRRKGGKGERRE